MTIFPAKAKHDPAPALPDWPSLLAPAAAMLALGIVGLADLIVLLPHLGIVGKQRDLAIFLAGTLLLAPLCAGIQAFLVKPDFGKPGSSAAEAVNIWTAIALLVALSAIPLLMYGGGRSGDFWLVNAERVVIAIALMQAAALAAVSRTSGSRWPTIRGILESRAIQVTTLLPAAFVGCAMLFSINSANHYLNFLVSLFADPPFAREPGAFPPRLALTFAAIAVAAVTGLGLIDATLARRARTSRLVPILGLWLACAAVLLLFDYSLAGDPFHYLTNVAPAMHILHGGALMVDTFSQYGSGPVLVTLLGFKLVVPSFGTAQLTVQFCNFLYYWLWLVCLFRMTQWKLAASSLGVLAIVFFFAIWGRGYGAVNESPSLLALRHLPSLLMVFALSNLSYPRRNSALTALATFISSQWSVETLVGTLGIHLAFLGLLGLRDRAFVRLVVDGIVATLPAIAGIITTSIVTLLVTGNWPDFTTYLAFLTSYNPLAEYWAIVANPMFFGWLPMFFAIFLVLGDVWMRVFRSPALAAVDDDALFYRFLPMTVLLMIQASYFVGRSVDFTLLMGLLSFCAIAIPATLDATPVVVSAKWPVKALALIPLAAALWALTFSFVFLLRQQSPYSMLLRECRVVGRCSPAALLHGLDETIHVRPVLEHIKWPAVDGAFDTTGTIRDGMAAIAQWAPNEPLVTVLLGTVGVNVTATELALMYSGKWNRWPRSFTLSDELVEPLALRIVAAPVRLREGEVVIARRDEKTLGYLEAGILQRIRSEVTLCQLPGSSSEVIAYRATYNGNCPPN